ncbi:MAG: M20/M25/M40 family metallo-hydrolase [Anaerovoracaceae bacterium]|jgi:arginine utilization protein RocB
MIDKNRIYENLKRLIEVPSISGTEDEIKGAYKIRDLLMEIPYFQEHPENVKLVPLVNDPLERSIVTAYLERNPENPATVILTGHYDVVDVEEYGGLKADAFDVEKISKEVGSLALDEDAQKDLESGEWIWGRGTADMKFGHAMCLELLRYFSEEGEINGNLLYVAVCGEETNSEGMLRAVPFFNQLSEEKGIDYKALLLTECYTVDEKARPDTRYIHMGASGKIMPMFFFAGEATHGEAPFLGMDPNLLSAEVMRRLIMDIDFCQSAKGEVTPPPVCLKNQDLKTTYSVSTPMYAASYYNIISVDLDPDAAMEKLKKIAADSFDAANAIYDERAAAYQEKYGIYPQRHKPETSVMTFKELSELARKNFKGDLDEEVGTLIRSCQAQKMEMQEISIRVVKRVYELAGVTHPTIVISIIPPYYPDVYPDANDPKVIELMKCLDDVIAYAKSDYDTKLEMRDYYMGLSDLSYTGLDASKNFDSLFENVVGVNQMYSLPEDDLKKFVVPGIVMGGYGKDFHKNTERLNRQYNFEVLPYLYIRLIQDLLK